MCLFSQKCLWLKQIGLGIFMGRYGWMQLYSWSQSMTQQNVPWEHGWHFFKPALIFWKPSFQVWSKPLEFVKQLPGTSAKFSIRLMSPELLCTASLPFTFMTVILVSGRVWNVGGESILGYLSLGSTWRGIDKKRIVFYHGGRYPHATFHYASPDLFFLVSLLSLLSPAFPFLHHWHSPFHSENSQNPLLFLKKNLTQWPLW